MDVSGTENEVVPLNTQPGSTHELTCPDSSVYFHHDGALTTAQYYVNRKGISKETACIWGKDGTSQGNWAPTVFGVGRDAGGKTWLSITTTAQNNPTSYKPLDYTATIEGDGLSAKCRVQNGQYCSGANYEDCNSSGCTVSLLTPKFHLFSTNSLIRSSSCMGKRDMSFQTNPPDLRLEQVDMTTWLLHLCLSVAYVSCFLPIQFHLSYSFWWWHHREQHGWIFLHVQSL